MKKVLALICGVSFSQFLFSATSEYYEPRTIRDIRVQANRNLISFRTNEAHHNPGECSDAGYYAVTATELRQEMLSVILAAHASKKAVGIVVDGTSCGPFGRPVVLQIRVL